MKVRVPRPERWAVVYLARGDSEPELLGGSVSLAGAKQIARAWWDLHTERRLDRSDRDFVAVCAVQGGQIDPGIWHARLDRRGWSGVDDR